MNNKAKSSKAVNKSANKKKYDLWSDPLYNDYDFQSELKQEYKDLGYNPRELKPVGKEFNDYC